MKDILFAIGYVGLLPAVLLAMFGLLTSLAKGGLRKLGRLASLLAGIFFAFASLALLYHIVTWTGSSGDGAGALFVFLFIGGAAVAALVCFALALRKTGEE